MGLQQTAQRSPCPAPPHVPMGSWAGNRRSRSASTTTASRPPRGALRSLPAPFGDRSVPGDWAPGSELSLWDRDRASGWSDFKVASRVGCRTQRQAEAAGLVLAAANWASGLAARAHVHRHLCAAPVQARMRKGRRRRARLGCERLAARCVSSKGVAGTARVRAKAEPRRHKALPYWRKCKSQVLPTPGTASRGQGTSLGPSGRPRHLHERRPGRARLAGELLLYSRSPGKPDRFAPRPTRGGTRLRRGVRCGARVSRVSLQVWP